MLLTIEDQELQEQQDQEVVVLVQEMEVVLLVMEQLIQAEVAVVVLFVLHQEEVHQELAVQE